MEPFKNKINAFMRGRYGVDELNQFLQFLVILLCILAIVLKDGNLTILLILLLGYMNFRIYSKNIEKRRKENKKFLELTSPIRRRLAIGKRQVDERKTHKYISCPKCKEMMRLPKGAGKIRVICPKCSEQFEIET